MRRALLRGGAIALAAAVVLAGCGGDDDDDSPQADQGAGATESTDATAEDVDAFASDDYVAAVAAVLADAERGMGIDQAGATCVAEALVDVVGVDALHDVGVTPEQFADADDLTSLDIDASDSAASDIAAGIADCDVAGQVETAFLGPELMSRSSCVADALDDEALMGALAASFVDLEAGGTAITDAVEPAIAACPAELTDLVIRAFSSAPEGEPPADVRACVEGYVQDNADQVAATLVGGDEADTTALVDEIGSRCPGF